MAEGNSMSIKFEIAKQLVETGQLTCEQKHEIKQTIKFLEKKKDKNIKLADNQIKKWKRLVRKYEVEL